AVEILAKGGFEMSEEAMAQYGEAISKMTSFDECKATLDENLKTMNAAISAFPESRLSEEITLPWGTFNFAEVMAIPAWNFDYHLGQINYIQTLYGDKEM
ncbi:MAG: DinB family protein, partial [Armatimonadetes bacterium]|nr:DinB family protein [Armatimonadota bacterium]